MDLEHFTIAMLARAMWHLGFQYTARYEDELAVLSGHVMRNRVGNAAAQGGWMEVLSTVNHERANEPIRPEDPRFLRILREAEGLYLQRIPDKVGGAIFYTPTARPRDVPERTITIGHSLPLYFYKDPPSKTIRPEEDSEGAAGFIVCNLLQVGVDL